ncbi:MAG: DNA primase [Parvibaculales bacterium]
MSLPRSFLEEIKNRVPVSDVVGRKVKLTRRGREFVGLSPFKNERTPSFTVNDDKQFYHCFATGKHGSVFDFLMETEGLSFIEAVERLASEANLPMPARDPKAAEREEKKLALVDVTEASAAWFRMQLNSAAGRTAADYLSQRGLSAELIKRFGVGYAPGRKDALNTFLLEKGFSQEQIIESGMALVPERDGPGGREVIDRFRDRVMFPIADAKGRVIAFGGRALSADAKAKYLNSPETPLFHKGRVLFNFDKARQPAYDEKAVIVCEGYMDVIGLARGGLDHAVAPLGTAITEDQIAMLWRLAPEPIMCLDGDEAGLRAAYRVIDRALPVLKPGFSLRFAVLPSGKDPDDIIRDSGRELMLDLLGTAKSLVDMLWDRELSFAPYDTPERRAALTDRLRKAVSQVQSPDVRRFYGDDIKQRLDGLFVGAQGGGAARGYGKSAYGRGGRGGFAHRRLASTEAKRSALASGGDMLPPREAMLVLCVLRHPEALIKELDRFENIELVTAVLDKLRFALLDAINNQNLLDTEALKTHLHSLGHSDLITRLEQLPDARMLTFVRDDSNPDDVRRGWLDALELQHKLTVLSAEMREIEKDLGTQTTQENFERLTAIKREMADLESL